MSGVVLYIEVELFLPFAHSLKDKRKIISSLQAAVRQTFKFPVAEVGYQDSWQRSKLAFVTVGSDRSSMLPLVDRLRDFLVERCEGEVSRYEVEWLK